MLEKYEDQDINIYATFARDPIDINWFNLGGEQSYYFLRYYCWNIMGLFLIIFISTPAVLFQTIKSLSLDFTGCSGEDKCIWSYILPFSYLYTENLTTLIVLTINLLLLILIDRVALSEKHASHSKYHSSVFSKAVVYLHLNMVLFPFLGLQEQSIYKALKSGTYQKEYIKDFTMLDSTPFFVNLIMQYGVFSSVFYLLRIGEMTQFYFSPRLTDFMRSKFNLAYWWRRRPDYHFQYGYFYSQMITVFTIIILFSSTSPMIVIAGTAYYTLRNIIDSHLLMSVHKKEIHSGVTMFQRISSLLLISLVFYQI